MLMLKSWLKKPQLRAFIYSLIFCLTGGMSQPAHAAFDPVNDDTDIFLANPNIPADRPNVLLYVDNTANWNQPFTNEKAALVNVINSLDESFNVGLMLFPETGAPNDNTDGGYLRFSIRQMTDTNKSVLASIVNNFDRLNDAGNNNTLSLGMVEVYRYYAGLAERASNVKIKTDYANNTTYQACSSCAVTSHPATAAGLGGHALASNSSGAIYTSPIDPTGCSSNYLIYISNGTANENAAALAIAESELDTAGYDTNQIINITPNGQQGNWMDEWAKFLATADVNGAVAGTPNVFTYTLEINPVTTNPGKDMTALMESVADNGKGAYFSATDASGGAEIEAALRSIFSQIQAVNSVFAAVTLPVSVNVRGTNLNQVYIGVFRPDANKKPRWFGNLKMYQLGFNNTTKTLFLADRNGINTENPSTGFIVPTAISFWTQSSNFWGFRPTNENGAGGASDLPDGDLVEKGGAAEQLRDKYATSQDARNLYTCTTGAPADPYPDCENGDALSATPFKPDNLSITATNLQLSTNNISNLTGFNTQTITALTDTRSVTAANTTKLNTPLNANLDNGLSKSISTIDRDNVDLKKATVTVTGHGFTTGESVVIYDVVEGEYNNTWTITSRLDNDNFVITNSVDFTTDIPDVSSAKVVLGPATIISLTNAAPQTITALTNVSSTFTISNAARVGSNQKTAVITTSADHNYNNNQTVYIYGFTTAEYNGTWTISSASGSQFTITKATNFSTANPSVTGAQVSTTTTIFTATVPNHGFTGGQVSISGTYTPVDSVFGATISLTGTYSIANITTNTFTFTGAASPPTSASVSATVGAATTVATATAANHGFTIGNHVSISGATPTGYNISDAEITVIDANTFTYTVPSGLASTTSGNITASLLGNQVVSVTAVTAGVFTVAGGYTNGANISISDAFPADYNGTFTITRIDDNSFTYDPGLRIPANTVTPITVSAGSVNSLIVTATIPDHKFGTACLNCISVVISGATGATAGAYNGTVTATIVDTNTITYPTVDFTTPDPATGTLTAHLATKTAFATVVGHGYVAPLTITIKGATPTDYNVTDVAATIVDADTFSYLLPVATSSPLGAATGIMTASLKTTTATATVVAHGYGALTPPVTVNIAGATPAAFNGTFTITIVDANTITYSLLPAPEQGDATGNITVSLVGAVAQSTIDDMIIWVRGRDNLEDENANSSLADARASIHGDVLHSRPAVVNYNRHGSLNANGPDGIAGTNDDNTTNDDVYIFFGANDGVFRAVKGGEAQSAPTEPFPGEEAWGFIPPELFGDLKRLRNNSPLISSTNKKPYFMDGSLGVFVKEAVVDGELVAADGDKVHIYISTHRGGRFVYALDVSNPLAPRLLWKHSNVDAGWEELGQTWSVPQVQTINASTNPVLIFGAGYDPTVEDVDTETITAIDSTTGDVTDDGAVTYTRSMGRGIFVVDAITGDILWQAGPAGTANATAAAADHTYLAVSNMIYAIPSDIAVIADRNSALRNRAYVGDTGGNLWRIDINDADVNNWTVTKLASIRDTSGLPTNPSGLRKFLFPPDVVHDDGGFDAVLIGSGDRDHPFEMTVINRMYMFKDYGIGTTPSNFGMTESDLFDATSNCIQTCTGGAQTAAINDLANADGWFITLGTGEKVVGNSVTLNNVTFFNTNQPTEGFNEDNPGNPLNAGGSCGSDLGVARQYQIRYDNAIAVVDQNNDGSLTDADRSNIVPGGGYLPSPVPFTTIIDGQIHEGVLSGTQVSDPPGTILGARLRKFWFKEFE